MIDSIVITQIGEMNQPWYALIMKPEQPAASVIIMKLERHILFIDPSAMTRGSVNIRNFQSYATQYNDETEACQMFDQVVGETSRKPDTSSIFRNGNRKIIYPASLAKILQTFPSDDAMYFATAATRHALAKVYGDNQQITAREKELERRISELEAGRRKKKRRDRPKY